MKRGSLYVDGVDVYEEYGVYVVEGGWNNLVGWPSLKSVETNDWQEEDGEEADLDAPVLDTRDAEVEFAVAGPYSDMPGFMELLADGAYHEFDCREIGRTYRLRYTSCSSLKTLKLLGKLKLKFSDDFPLEGYEYKAPESSLWGAEDWMLDDVPLLRYGVRVLKDSYDSVMEPASTKENLLRKIDEEPGVEYDGKNVTYKSKDVKLVCLMRAESLEALWRNWDALLYDLAREGERLLYVGDVGQEFPCCYKGCKVKEFKSADAPWLKFELTVTFLHDFRIHVGYTDTYTWSDVSLTYPEVANTGGECNPTLTYKLTRTRTHSDGRVTTTEWTSGAATTWEIRLGAAVRTFVSIDADTGKLVCDANEEDDEVFIGRVTATLTLEGQETSANCQVWQAARTYTDEYSDVSVSLSYPEASGVVGDAISPEYSYSQTRTRTYSDGTVSTTTVTSGGTLAWSWEPESGIGDIMDTETGVITPGVNESESERTLGVARLEVTLNGKTGSAECEVKQEAGFTKPVVTLVRVDKEEAYGNASDVWFSVDITMNSASEVTPSYLLDTEGNRYDVEQEGGWMARMLPQSSGLTLELYCYYTGHAGGADVSGYVLSGGHISYTNSGFSVTE